MDQAAKDEAAKERIIKHMNSDHQDSLFRYLEYFCHLSSFSARNARLERVTLDSLSISTGRGKLHLVPIQPAMGAWSEARTRFADLDARAVEGLGRSNITVKKYTRPRGHSTRDPVFEPQNSAIPNLRPDPPIRKIVEPPIIDKLRQLCNDRMKHTYDYTHSPGSEPLQLDSASPTASVLHYRPGSKIRRIGSKPPVGINPFRDIYYVPPKGKMTPRNPNESPFLANSFRYSNKAPSAESQPLFRRQATSTIPYRNLAFKRKAQKSFQPVVRQQRSSLSTSTARHSPASTNAPAPEPLDIDEYHQLADTFIDNLVLKLEEIQEERNDVDCEYSSGVLTLTFPPAGTYVLNKQPPNKQIWLSSPISGPKRYDFVAADPPETDEALGGGDGASRGGAGVLGEEEKRGDWIYLRDGSSLSGLLREELGVGLGI
ncbi:MAG: hypothetical protein LQ338_007100 [Usnochroma carphineum]|nr:MAG: hypothetical protein LQ338_007100 [Usnochroma carphineum]